jgi:hypothetical protein
MLWRRIWSTWFDGPLPGFWSHFREGWPRFGVEESEKVKGICGEIQFGRTGSFSKGNELDSFLQRFINIDLEGHSARWKASA